MTFEISPQPPSAGHSVVSCGHRAAGQTPGLTHFRAGSLQPLTHFPFPHPAPATTKLLSTSMNSAPLDSRCKGEHAEFIFLCRSISLSITPLRSIRVVTKGSIARFLRLNITPSHVHVCVCMCMCVRYAHSLMSFAFLLAQTVCFLAMLPPSRALSPPHPWRPGPPAHLLPETSLTLSASTHGAHAYVFGSGQPCPLLPPKPAFLKAWSSDPLHHSPLRSS